MCHSDRHTDSSSRILLDPVEPHASFKTWKYHVPLFKMCYKTENVKQSFKAYHPNSNHPPRHGSFFHLLWISLILLGSPTS